MPHKPTPQQTAKSQQVHTHQSDESTADTTKIETTPSDPLLQWSINLFTPLMMMPQTSPRFFQLRGLDRIQVCKRYIFSNNAITPNNQLVDRGSNGGLAGSDMRVIYKTHRKINISGIDNHEVNGLDVGHCCNPPQHFSWKSHWHLQ